MMSDTIEGEAALENCCALINQIIVACIRFG
jgi:hypothetical protein